MLALEQRGVPPPADRSIRPVEENATVQQWRMAFLQVALTGRILDTQQHRKTTDHLHNENRQIV
jgi:hypothetical protein